MSVWPVLICRGLLVLTLLALMAGEPTTAPDKLRVSVVAILGSETSTEVDKDLGCVAKHLKDKGSKLTGFRLQHVSSHEVVLGEKSSFDLVDDLKACITVRKSEEKEKCVAVKLCLPDTGSVTYSTQCTKYFPVVTKHRTDKGEVLIVAVSVCGCKYKEKAETHK